jgi:hypothetical protein
MAELPKGPSGRLLASGRWNLADEVGDGACCWVVRRPPLGACWRRRTAWAASPGHQGRQLRRAWERWLPGVASTAPAGAPFSACAVWRGA